MAEEELEVDVISAVMEAFQHHLESSKVIKSACLAFSYLISLYGKNYKP